MREWNPVQRIVLLVAWGASLVVGWNRLERSSWNDYGMFNSAPNSGEVFSSAPLADVWLRLAVQLLLVVMWLIPGLWLLSDRRRTDRGDSAESSGNGEANPSS